MAVKLFIAVTIITVAICFCDGAKRSIQPNDITKLHISSNVQFRYAVTTIESHVNNYNANASEVVFHVTLPRSAFISRFSMVIDNVTYPGHVREKEVAKKEYEAAKEKGQSAGIIKQKPRDTNVFVVSVNVAAKGEVDFTLVYEEVLTRKFGRYEQTINVNPGQIVSDLSVRVSIDESRPLTSVRAPPLKTGNEIAVVEDGVTNPLAKIEKISESKATITFNPSKSDQKKMGASGISGQFSVEYDVDHKTEGGEIQVVDGYFVHFFAPKDLPHLNKHIYFVLDVSGSMSGKKIEQMREAMLLILDDLNEGDLFTLMKFSDDPAVWVDSGDEVHGVSPLKIKAAKKFIQSLEPEGSTNAFDSLKKAIDDLDQDDSNAIASNSFYRANVVVFLTDGQPTAGSITTPDRIVSALSEHNAGKNVVLYSLGFGDDVDFKFLQRLSAGNGGFARKIYQSSDATLQLVDFYKEISSPLLANMDFVYLNAQVINDSLTQTEFNIFYEGTEIVIAGRLADSLPPTYEMVSTISGTKAGGELTWTCGTEVERPQPFPESAPAPSSYLERLWAYLTIQQKLEKKSAMKAISGADETSSTDEIKAVDDEILKLALKYEFVTPLTAMVVTKPELDASGGRNLTGSPSSNVVDSDEGSYGTDSTLMSNSHSNLLSNAYTYDDYDDDYHSSFSGISGNNGLVLKGGTMRKDNTNSGERCFLCYYLSVFLALCYSIVLYS